MALLDIYQAALVFDAPQADGEMVNVIHFQLLNIGTPDTEDGYCVELAQTIVGVVEFFLLPYIATDITFTEVRVFNVNQPTYMGVATSGNPGTGTTEWVGPRVAVVATKRTGLRGRSYRGRMFIPGVQEGQQNAGTLSAGAITNYQAYVDNLVSMLSLASNQYIMVVYSAKLLTATPVSSVNVQNNTGTIRGRKKV